MSGCRWIFPVELRHLSRQEMICGIVRIWPLIHQLLNNFGIDSKVDEKYNEVVITRRKNLERFYKKINFSLGIFVNSKRSNSIWKKSLEKRQILRNALDSYIKKRDTEVEILPSSFLSAKH